MIASVKTPFKRPLFHLGKISITDKAQFVLKQGQKNPLDMLEKHVVGQHGLVDEKDRAVNRSGYSNFGIILSCYRVGRIDVWVITDPGHARTTILLPEEY